MSEPKKIKITQDTNYPFGNNVTFTFNKVPNKVISLALFVPNFMKVKKLSINGKPIEPTIQNSFIRIKSNFSIGDQIIMDYAFNLSWVIPEGMEMRKTDFQKVMYGPLVLAGFGNETILIKKGATIGQTNENEFTVEGTNLKLTPLYHLLDPQVSDQKGYNREVLFNMQTIN